jgi:hypothetical protein
VNRGEIVTRWFTLTNKGWRALTIGRVMPSCGVRAVVPPESSIARGHTLTVRLDVDTIGLVDGMVTREVRLETNDPMSRTVTLRRRSTSVLSLRLEAVT